MREQQEELSPEMTQILREEAVEAEILGAMDAAAEEGFYISREEAIKILLKETQKASVDLPKLS